MAISHAAALKLNDQLHEQLRHLQDDWNSYKQSVHRRRHRRSCSSTTTTAASADGAASLTPDHFLKLLDRSPKKLLSSLQHSKDEKVEEVVTARRQAGIDGGLEEIICSVSSSSDLTQVPPEAHYSSCSCDESSGDDGRGYGRGGYQFEYLASCSSLAASSESEEIWERTPVHAKENGEGGSGGGEWWNMARIGLYGAIVLVALASSLIIYVREFVETEEYDHYMVPT